MQWSHQELGASIACNERPHLYCNFTKLPENLIVTLTHMNILIQSIMFEIVVQYWHELHELLKGCVWAVTSGLPCSFKLQLKFIWHVETSAFHSNLMPVKYAIILCLTFIDLKLNLIIIARFRTILSKLRSADRLWATNLLLMKVTLIVRLQKTIVILSSSALWSGLHLASLDFKFHVNVLYP